jgi:Tfp pilus assembly protein PilO
MIDILPIAGMIFSLLMVLVIGGFILLYPLSKRLGKLIELRLEERRAGSALPEEQLQVLADVVAGLQEQLERIEERQAFTERLLETGRPGPDAREDAPTAAAPDGS